MTYMIERIFYRMHSPIVFMLASAFALASSPASASEVTLFLSGAKPSLAWKQGFGGAFGITLFNVGGLEVEGAHQTGEVVDSGLLTLSGRVFIAPTFGRVVPYGGLSVGAYRATLGSDDDWGTMTGVFVGAKLKLPLGLLLRGEYQWTHFPEGALVPMDARYYAGVGLGF
jgi:hypothetical protein